MLNNVKKTFKIQSQPRKIVCQQIKNSTIFNKALNEGVKHFQNKAKTSSHFNNFDDTNLADFLSNVSKFTFYI
jgi:hypothetical protein